MAEMSKIEEAYIGFITKALNFKIDDGWAVINPVTGKSAKVDGLPLYVPVKAMLKKGELEGRYFHPICENILKGQSSVLKWTKNKIEANVSTYIDQLMSELLRIASTEIVAKSLNQTQSSLIDVTSGIDDAVVQGWKSLVKKVAPTASRSLVSITLLPSGDINGEKFHRLATMFFPILDETDKSGAKLWDVNFKSKPRRQVIFDVLTYILGANEFVYGSNGAVPYFEALIGVYLKFLTRYNTVVNRFKKVIDLKPLDLSWVEAFEDTSSLVGRIPAMEGNAGATLEKAVPTADEVRSSVLAKLGDDDSSDVPWNRDENDVVVARATKPREEPTKEVALDEFDAIRRSRELVYSESRGSADRDRDRDRDYERSERRARYSSRGRREEAREYNRGRHDPYERADRSTSYNPEDIFGRR